MRPKSTVLAPVGTSGRANDPTDPEAIVRVLFEKSPLLIYIADLDFKIVLINRALRESTGYDTSDCREVAGLLERFYPDPDYRRLVAGIHEGWHRNEHIRETELVASLKGGGQKTISWSTSRLRVGRGPTTGFIAVGVDVTTRRNLQQWVGLFQRSLQHLEEGVVLTDPTGAVLAWSAGAQRLLGHADEVMQGRQLKDLYLRGERELIARTVDRAIESQGQYTGEVELEHADGSNRILVFKQHRLDGEAGTLARLTLLSEPRADEEMESRLADSQLLAVQLQEQLDRERQQLAERDRLLGELERVAHAAAGEAAESRTRVGELEQLLAATEGAASDAQSRLIDLEAALASVDATAPARVVELEAALASVDTTAPARVVELEAALTATDSAVHQARARADELEHTLASTGAAASQAQLRAEELEQALAESYAAAREAQAQVAELEAAVLVAEAAVTEASSHAERAATDTAVNVAIAQGEAADAHDALFETQTRLEEATARAVNAEQQVAGLEADLSMLADQVGEVEEHCAAQVEDARSALEEATVKLVQAVQAAGEASGRAADLETELAQLRADADQHGAELAQAEQQAQARLAELESELALARRQAETREAHLERELAASREVAATAPEAQARVASLEAELDQARQRADARTAELDGRLAEARKEIEALGAAQGRATAMEEELHAAASRIRELEAELDRLRADTGARQGDLEAAIERSGETFAGQRAELEGALELAQAEAAEGRTALEQAQAEAAEAQAALAQALSDAADRQAEQDKAVEQAAEGAGQEQTALAVASQEAERRVEELQAALGDARHAGDLADGRVADAEARAEEFRDHLDDARHEAAALEGRLRGELDDVRRVAAERTDELTAELARAQERAAASPVAASPVAADAQADEPTDAGQAPVRDPRLLDIEAELEDARSDVAARVEELEQVRIEADKRAAELQAEVDRLLEAQKTAVIAPVADAVDDEASARIAALEANLKEAKRQAAVGTVELAMKLATAQKKLKATRLELEAAGSGGVAVDPEELLALKASLAEAQGKVATAESEVARVPALEARVAELEGASQLPDPRIVELEAELVEARRKVEAQHELIQAGEESRLAAEKRAEGEAAGRTELQGRLVDADQRAAELQAQLEAAEAGPTDAEDDAATRAHSLAEVEEQLRSSREQAEGEAAEAAERWVQQRASLEEQHRTEVSDVQARAADERQALEAQLSKDILAAEERAEADRQKMLDRHDQERKEWEDAAAIARAEAESRLRQEVDRVNARAEGSGNLQPYLARLRTVALAVADIEGRVFGWSGGASQLDVRDDLDALGAFLHKDVLRLDGVDWKSLLGKVVVHGGYETDATLVARGGARKLVQLTATLVRDAQNQPIGVIEVVREPQLEASLETHAHAAVARLAMPLHGALETRAVAGLKNNQRTSAAVKDLLLVSRAVHAGEAWEDVESAARRVDLGELVEVSEDLVRRSEDTWRELRATVKDLQWLEDVVRAGQTTRHRWNELVSRCLHAIEDVGGKRARRSLGNQVFVEGRGDQLVPLLVTLFGPIAAATGDVEVTTAVTDTTAHVQIAGITLEPDSRRLAARLADLAGGQLAAGDPISLTVPLELPDEATAAIVEVASGEDTRPVSPRVPSPSLDSEETVPPSAGLDIADLVPQASAQLRVAEVDSAIPEIETLPDSEESDRQTQPGMPSILLSKKDGAAGSILGGPPKETLVLEAGDDAILADPDEVRAAIEEDMDGGSDLPDIDELEQLFDAAVGVSTAVLAAADEMEAYASVKEDTADELSDGAAAAGEVHIPPSADVKTDAGMALRSTAPEPAIEALPEEASVTDTGDKMSVVVKKATKPTKVRSRGRSKKKSRSRKKRS